MKGTDLNIVNLETTFTLSNRKVYKEFAFKSAPDNVKSLISASISVASLANNHILDFANEGLFETINTLDQAGIKHVGAGMSLTDAAAPLKIQKKTFTVGLLGFTDNEPSWKADGGPGINYINIDNREDHSRVISAVKMLRKETDLVIVSIHWGPNMREKPPQEFITFAHILSRHGVDVVHGHSAHIIQGIECYNDSLILYDTGDFIDDYAVDPELRNDLSAFFILRVNKSGLLDLQVIPTRIFQYQVNVARQEDHDWVIRRLQQLSLDFGTHINDEGRIKLNSHDLYQLE
jgi:poly-gamma-glutamate synthesis protein (capsule biosynthesis protein)